MTYQPNTIYKQVGHYTLKTYFGFNSPDLCEEHVYEHRASIAQYRHNAIQQQNKVELVRAQGNNPVVKIRVVVDSSLDQVGRTEHRHSRVALKQQ